MSLEEMGLEEKARERAASGAAEQEGPDLKDILADKKLSSLFAEERRLANDGGAFGRYLEGKYDDNDVRELGAQVEGFNAVIAKADKLAETLSGRDLEAIIDSSPDLKRMSSLNKEGVREMFKRYLPDIAIRDAGHFKQIVRKMEAREKTREQGAKYDKAIADFCVKFGIDEKKYYELIKPGHEEELRSVVRAKLDPIRRFFSMSKKTSDEIDLELVGLPDKASVDQYLQTLEYNRKTIGDVLSLTLIESDTMRRALAAETQGLRIEDSGEEADMNFADVRNALRQDQAQVKDRFQKFEAKYKNDQKYQKPGGGGYDRDLLIHDFEDAEIGPIIKNKKGFLKDTLKNVLFPNFIERLI